MDLASLLDPERLAFHKRVVEEEAAAAAACDELLTGPSAWWGNAIRNAGIPKTAGLVRTLVERSVRAVPKAPADSLLLAQLATHVAYFGMDSSVYPEDHVARVCGEAHRQEAWVLSVLGNTSQAQARADDAERCFKTIPACDVDLARLDLVRANIARERACYGEAIELARRAAETFLWFGDESRWVAARGYEAAAYWHAGDFRRALEIWESTRDAMHVMTAEQRIALFHNMGMCARELGDPAEAVRYFTRSIAEAERSGNRVSAAMGRASLGVALLLAGQTSEAIDMLREAWEEEESLGLAFNAVFTALRLAEALLMSGATSEVPPICRALVERCTRAGMTEQALTALALLREAAATGQATPQQVRHVHDFLRDGDARL